MLNVRCSNLTLKITHLTFQFRHHTSDFELFPDTDTDTDTDPELKCTLGKTCLVPCHHLNAGVSISPS